MPNSQPCGRAPPQFTLRSLLALVALTAFPLTLAHYWLYAPEFSTGILAAVVVFALLVTLGLAHLWNQRSRRPTFGGLVLKVIAVSVVVYLLACLLLPVVQMARE